MITNFDKNKNRGFTIIETFVAITVLLIAVLGPLILLTRSISDGNYAKNQVTASFLAQEGLDLVVALSTKYTNNINTSLKNFTNCDRTHLCTVSADSEGDVNIVGICPLLLGCFSLGDTVLFKEESSLYLHPASSGGYGYYNHDSTNGTKTIFKREVWFQKITTDPVLAVGSEIKGQTGNINDEFIGYRVYVGVNWNDKGISRSTIVSTIVYE